MDALALNVQLGLALPALCKLLEGEALPIWMQDDL
jgi:hypothetical protein